MITAADIDHWRTQVPWQDPDTVEQDLVLARLMIEISQHRLLGNELIMRGGTCFHKLWLDRPWRYSEDLDYVRRSDGPIGPLLDAIREVASAVGFDGVSTSVRRYPKARLDAEFNSGRPMTVKVEINTFERTPARETVTRTLAVDSPWYVGRAEVPTFVLAELVATKIRALYQRRKGRDLFDLWLAVEHGGLSPEAIADCFHPYYPEGWTPALAISNLDEKLRNQTFLVDLASLVPEWPAGYSLEAGAEIARAVIAAIES